MPVFSFGRVCYNKAMNEEMLRSLITTYRKDVWSPFTKAVRDYQLIKENDRIAVCISGGKDSFMLALVLEELRRHVEVPFELVYLCLDPGYDEETREMIRQNAEKIGIDLQYSSAVIFRYVETLDTKPCYICARMRRGALYTAAKELGCNKIALGHHYDDVVETILMSVLYSGQMRTMLPKLKAENFEGMELIRPLYLTEERGIRNFWKHHGMEFIQCACSLTKKRFDEDYEHVSKRAEVKRLIRDLEKTNPFLKSNIFRSAEKVNVETVLSYRDKDGVHESWDTDKK